MIIGRIEKQPIERKEYRFDYDPWLIDGETILNVNWTLTPNSSLQAKDLIIDPIDGRSFLVVFSGGISGVNYKFEVTIETNPPENYVSRVKQDELFITVIDR